MEKYFALIQNNLVKSVIVADDSFITGIQANYDYIIDVTEMQRPSPDDSYYPDTGIFVSNVETVIDIPVDLSADYLHQGTEDGFEPFNLSEYPVSYSEGMVTIGCKEYSAPGLLECLHKVLIEEQDTVYCFTTQNGDPCHGKFQITWDDAQLLYNNLVKVKF